MEQIILNLAVNARDAMPDGGKLNLTTKNVELSETLAGSHARIPPGKYVVLTVSDTGIGMHSDVQARIFEPFLRPRSPGRGTGLGLSIVYGVVKQSGGWITACSEVANGATFNIYFPQMLVDEPVTEPASKAKAPSSATARGTETVLVVEDQDGIREVIREFLQRNGYFILHAADGNEALQVAEDYKHPIHLLLTDVVMPNVGGRELAHRLTKSRPQVKSSFHVRLPRPCHLDQRTRRHLSRRPAETLPAGHPGPQDSHPPRRVTLSWIWNASPCL